MFIGLEASSSESCPQDGRETWRLQREGRGRGTEMDGARLLIRGQMSIVERQSKWRVEQFCSDSLYNTDSQFFICTCLYFFGLTGMHTGTRQEEVIDHRLTDREWAEEWKHLDHVRKVITFLLLYLNNPVSVSNWGDGGSSFSHFKHGTDIVLASCFISVKKTIRLELVKICVIFLYSLK